MNDFPRQSGIYQLTAGSRQHSYTLAIPADYAESVPMPLVIALHWGGQSALSRSRSFLVELIEPALRGLGALIVAPECQHGKWNNPDSESAVMSLLRTLQAHYRIDGNRVILTGYSMGGTGTWYIATRHQDRFAAAIIMAAPAPDLTQSKWQIPLYIIHSRHDERFPIEPTIQAVQQLETQGSVVKFVVLDGVTHHHAARFLEPLHAAVSWLRELWLP